MDATLTQLIQQIIDLTRVNERQAEQIRHLQAEYTDIKQQLEAHDALANPVGRP